MLDAVIAFEVIEHLPDVLQALDEMLRVLRRPGHVIIGLPNHASLWTPIEDRLRGRTRRAFGVEHGRGACRWWRRNAGLAWHKRLSRGAEFLYRQPILDAAQGGDADAVYYAAPRVYQRAYVARSYYPAQPVYRTYRTYDRGVRVGGYYNGGHRGRGFGFGFSYRD